MSRLEVSGSVTLAHAAGVTKISGAKQNIVLDFTSFSSLMAFVSEARTRTGFTSSNLTTLHNWLCRAGLKSVVRVKGRPVGDIGWNVRPGLVGRVLGISPAGVRPWGLVRSWLFDS